MHPKVNEAPPSHRLRRRHGTRLETVPDEVSVPSDGIARKGSQPPDDEAPSPTRLRLEPHLDLVPDDLPEDGHRQLDMEALERLKRWTRDGSGFDSPFPDPPLLLFTILAFSDGVNPRYRDIPQLELFLKEDPDVGQMLKETWTDRTFKKIRNIAAFRQVSQPMAVSLQNSQPELPNPARKDSVYPADSDTADTTQSNPNAFISDTPVAELRQYLEGLRDKVMLLFNGQRKLRVWQVQHGPYQDHVASLALPMLERLPSLLIHDLGRLKHDDQLDARIAGLFQRGSSQPIFLCNTSGSGKTRLIFEGFTRHWGMYFTSRTEPDHVGSKDLSAAVADLATKFHVITPQNHSRALPHNRSVVTHKEGLPATNHLLLKNAEFWSILSSPNPGKGHISDYPVLMQHLLQFSGRSLVTVQKPGDLFVAIVHAALGYRNLIEKGFQHRDISIGNVLWLNPPRRTKTVFETFQGGSSSPGNHRAALETQLKQSGVDELCRGFLIDGDMAVELESYYMKAHEGSRSGTEEFMSEDLLRSARFHKPYLQSPVDDLWSLYYVAQWAAVFNNTNFSGMTVPVELLDLRCAIAGSPTNRDSGTRRVTNVAGLDRAEYGHFLASCCSILRQWEAKLAQLAADWKAAKVDSFTDGNLYNVFRDFTDRALLELVQLIEEHFPNSLCQ